MELPQDKYIQNVFPLINRNVSQLFFPKTISLQ